MKRKFPRYLSAPFQVLWFELDDLLLMFFLAALGLVLRDGLLWGLSILAPYIYSKIKRRHPRGFLKHSFYFLGLVQMKGYPVFFDKHFIE